MIDLLDAENLKEFSGTVICNIFGSSKYEVADSLPL